MLRFTLNRLFWFVPTILAIIALTFVILKLTPGTGVIPAGSQQISEDMIRRLEAQFGLDKPLYVLGAGLAGFGLARLANRASVRAGRRDTMLNHLLSDLRTMPPLMKRLAQIQFLSWSALFILWIYATPVVVHLQFGALDPPTCAQLQSSVLNLQDPTAAAVTP